MQTWLSTRTSISQVFFSFVELGPIPDESGHEMGEWRCDIHLWTHWSNYNDGYSGSRNLAENCRDVTQQSPRNGVDNCLRKSKEKGPQRRTMYANAPDTIYIEANCMVFRWSTQHLLATTDARRATTRFDFWGGQQTWVISFRRFLEDLESLSKPIFWSHLRNHVRK